jgi:hypothetical protein
MGMFGILPFLFIIFYLTVFGVVFYLVYTWVNKFIALRQEQNNLLREIVKKMDQK